MNRYKHRFEHAEEYLHHRHPYLLVDEILSITSTEVMTSKTVEKDAFFVEGHFPGAPIMPGAMLQELTTQTAGILIAAEHNPMREFNTANPFFNEYALGVLVKVKGARFKSFSRPGDTLTAKVVLNEHVGNIFDFTGELLIGKQRIMRSEFQLTNIKSEVLQSN